MFLVNIHAVLAFLSVIAMALISIEGGVRAVLNRAPGQWASREASAMLFSVAVTVAAGLVLLLAGHRPHDWLHLMYALIAFAIVPTADNISRNWSIRGRAMSRCGGGVLGLGIFLRLFLTG